MVAVSKAAASRSRASKVADSRSQASKAVSRAPDKAASKVAADSRSRASSVDSANFSSRGSFPGFEPVFFYSDF